MLIIVQAQDVWRNNVFFQIPTMVISRPAVRLCGGLSIAWPRFLPWLAIVLLCDLSPSSLPIALIAVALESWERHLTSLRFSCDLCERNCSRASCESTLKAGNELLLIVSGSWKELKGEQGTADDPDNAFWSLSWARLWRPATWPACFLSPWQLRISPPCWLAGPQACTRHFGSLPCALTPRCSQGTYRTFSLLFFFFFRLSPGLAGQAKFLPSPPSAE